MDLYSDYGKDQPAPAHNHQAAKHPKTASITIDRIGTTLLFLF